MAIIVVEDEALIAMELEDILEELGHRVLGVAATTKRAIEMLTDPAERIDAVLLDANLGGASSKCVAETLEERQIPFLITSGYTRDELRSRGLNAPCVNKPYTPRDIQSALNGLAYA